MKDELRRISILAAAGFFYAGGGYWILNAVNRHITFWNIGLLGAYIFVAFYGVIRGMIWLESGD